jgi:low affinity Fe/Cu permease
MSQQPRKQQNQKFRIQKVNKGMNKEVKGLTKDVAEMKAKIDELIRQRVTETEEKNVKPKDAALMSQEEFFASIDALIEAKGFDYSQPDDGYRQTYITNEYSMMPFAMFCSMLYIDVTANVVNNFGKISLPDFVTYCCVVLQLSLTANPDIIGHAGVTAEMCNYASRRLEDLIIPDAVYFAMQSYKPFITEDGRTRVIFSPYQWETHAGAAIPSAGPVPTRNIAVAHIPGGNRDVSDIDTRNPIYSIVTRTGTVVAQDQASHNHCIRSDPISSYLTNILPIPQAQAVSTGLTANILNAWIEAEVFDRPLHYSAYMSGYRGNQIQHPTMWITMFLTIGEALGMMKQFSHVVKSPGKGTFQHAYVKKCPGHIVTDVNGRIVFISQSPREKFVPVFVMNTFANENAFTAQLAAHQVRGAAIREDLLKVSYVDQRDMSCSWLDLGQTYLMLAKGDAGPLKALLKMEFA